MTKYSLNNLEDFFRVLIKDREKKEEEIGEGSPDLKVDISELPDYLKKFAEALGGYGKWSAEMTGVWDSTDLDRFGEGIRLFKDRNETI